MLEASLTVAWTTTYRCTASKPHWAHGKGELSVGRPADPRRVAEARIHRLRTHGVAVSAPPTDDTVADLAERFDMVPTFQRLSDFKGNSSCPGIERGSLRP